MCIRDRATLSPGPIRQTRRWLTVSAHQIKCELKSASFWKRLLFTCLQLSTIAYGVFRAGLKTGVIAFGGFLVVWFFRSWRDGRNPNLKQFERNAAAVSYTHLDVYKRQP